MFFLRISSPYHNHIYLDPFPASSMRESVAKAQRLSSDLSSGAVFKLLVACEAKSESFSFQTVEKLAQMVNARPSQLKPALELLKADPRPEVRRLAQAVASQLGPEYVSLLEQSPSHVLYSQFGLRLKKRPEPETDPWGYVVVNSEHAIPREADPRDPHYRWPQDGYNFPQRPLPPRITSAPTSDLEAPAERQDGSPPVVGYPPNRPAVRA